MYDPNDEKHAESEKRYPTLDLTEGEFVVADVRRHPIGLISVWFVTLLIVGVILILMTLFYQQSSMLADNGITINPDAVLGAAMLLTLLVLLIGWVGTIIYRDNRFYVTNESVIQHVRTGLFASRQQIIALSGIEDASYHQDGILQYILGYGSIRLSTVGDETTYRFTLVANPQDELRILNEAVEAFKRREHGMPSVNPQPAAPVQPSGGAPSDPTS